MTSLDTALAWLDAVNRHDPDAVIALSHPSIEIVGPRGSGHGHELLLAWLGSTRVHLAPHAVFAAGDVVVVEQHGVWRSPENNEVIGEADVASRLCVADDLVVLYACHDTLSEALTVAGLTHTDRHDITGEKS